LNNLYDVEAAGVRWEYAKRGMDHEDTKGERENHERPKGRKHETGAGESRKTGPIGHKTIRLTISVGALKFMSKPTRRPVAFKYDLTWA
jgi:hypothetical protein